MTSKWTPGPWETFGPIAYQVYGGNPSRRIAVIDWTTGSDSEEHASNARLIAAAPELAETLRQIIDFSELDQYDRDKALDALAVIKYKARAALAKLDA